MFKTVEVWDHFKNSAKYKSLCIHCHNIYSHNGSKHNLLQHLVLKHIDKLGIVDAYNKFSRKTLWQYFSKVGDDKMAKCNLCEKMLSYKTTVTNLKVHLSRSHSEAFLRMLQNLPPDEHNDRPAVCADPISNALSPDEDSHETDHLSTDVWSFFEQETGGRARCVVCRLTFPNNHEDVRNHLVEDHPKLLPETNQDTVTAISDESGNEESNYTEVIYVQEEPKGRSPKYYVKETKPSSSKNLTQKVRKTERERRVSVSSDDLPIKKKRTIEPSTSSEPDQLDSFLTYIKCLLRQVPNDVCAKLQLDIVNLIMKAKLRGVGETVHEISMNVPREVNIERDVISVALADANIASLQENHCYVQDKNEH